MFVQSRLAGRRARFLLRRRPLRRGPSGCGRRPRAAPSRGDRREGVLAPGEAGGALGLGSLPHSAPLLLTLPALSPGVPRQSPLHLPSLCWTPFPGSPSRSVPAVLTHVRATARPASFASPPPSTPRHRVRGPRQPPAAAWPLSRVLRPARPSCPCHPGTEHAPGGQEHKPSSPRGDDRSGTAVPECAGAGPSPRLSGWGWDVNRPTGQGCGREGRLRKAELEGRWGGQPRWLRSRGRRPELDSEWEGGRRARGPQVRPRWERPSPSLTDSESLTLSPPEGHQDRPPGPRKGGGRREAGAQRVGVRGKGGGAAVQGAGRR